eukprot:396293-Rhodomonas_salina.3
MEEPGSRRWCGQGGTLPRQRARAAPRSEGRSKTLHQASTRSVGVCGNGMRRRGVDGGTPAASGATALRSWSRHHLRQDRTGQSRSGA